MIRRSRSASKSSKSLSLSLSILLPLRWGLQVLKNVYISVFKISKKKNVIVSLWGVQRSIRALTKGSRTNVFAIDIYGPLIDAFLCRVLSLIGFHFLRSLERRARGGSFVSFRPRT